MAQTRGRARELAILQVVTELLAEQGYERLTVDAVAAKARASKATIYTRWPDKASLVSAALNAQSLEQPRVSEGAQSLREDLQHFVGLCVVLAESESLTAFASVLLASENEPALGNAVRHTALAPRRQDCLDIAVRAVERGEIDRVEAASEIFDLTMGKIFVRYLLEREPLSLQDQIDFVDNVILPVVQARSSVQLPAR